MWIWLAIAVVAAIGEILTVDLFLASVAAAAIVAAGVGFAVGVPAQIAVFAVVSLLGILVFRPLIKSALGIDSSVSNVASASHPHLAGRRAVVTQTVDASGGQVRIGQGEFWSARTYNPNGPIPPGAVVEIVLVDGLTALVAPVQQTSLEVTPDDEPATKGSVE
jgi:membrane protein implicated in regulation of membrane protease activity